MSVPHLHPVITVFVVFAAQAAASPPSIQAVGDLPGGSVYSEGLAVSADGSYVVGFSSNTGGGYEAYRWSNGVISGLGDLGGTVGYTYSFAYGASSDGSVVVGDGASVNGGEAFRWSNGVLTGLGDLPGGTFGSAARGVSSDGSVVVGYSSIGSDYQHYEAFRWSNGVMSGLGDLPGGLFRSSAYAVSSDGSVVVGNSNSAGGWEAFRWSDGQMSGLGDLPGGTFRSGAYGLSADGSVVVGASDSAKSNDPYGGEAFRWSDGLMSGLGDLPGGSFYSRACATSSDGSVVVGQGTSASGTAAFIWSAATGMLNLHSVLADMGADCGWRRLLLAQGISADGTAIAGTGVDPNGDTQGFVAHLSFNLVLNVVNPSWGTLSIEPNLPEYTLGTPVTLSAVPIEGKAFRHWEIYDPNHPGDANFAIYDANSTTTIIMYPNREVTAAFKCGSGLAPLVPLVACLLTFVYLVRKK